MNRSLSNLKWAIAVFSLFAVSCSSPIANVAGNAAGEASRLTVAPNNVGKLVNLNSTAEAKALKTYLDQMYGKKIISGQMDQKYLSYIKDTTGKEPAIMGYDFNGLMPSQGGNNDADKAIDWVKNRNGIAQFMWHWISPDANGDFYTSNFSLSNALANPNGSSYKNMIRDIDLVAGQLKKLQDANVAVLWRPLHEAEGGWFWWGKSGGDAAKKLYRLIYDRFVNFHKLNNLIWVWTSYGGTQKGNWYPGDDVVDMIVWDYETPDSWNLFNSLFGNSGKIFGLGEEGKLPDPNNFAAKPWSYFLTWAYMVKDPAEDSQGKNSKAWLKQVYNDPRVITLSDLPVKTFAANAGNDVAVFDTDGNGFETVTLDGSGSTGGATTITSYTWKEGTTVLGTGSSWTGSLPIGVHTVTLEVGNNLGQTALDTVTVTVQVPPPVPVSRGKPVTTSSNESAALSGGNAVDGSSASRWASASGSDPQWLTIDLQNKYDIQKVGVNWEAASARDYELQISNDGTNFTRFDGRTAQASGARTDVLTNAATGRYLRVWGTARTNTSWGYSIFEIEVTGTVSSNPSPSPTPSISPTPSPSPIPTPSPSPSPVVSPSPLPSALTATYSKTDWGGGFTATIVIKNNGTSAVTNGWKLTFTFPGNQTVTNGWSGVYTQTGTQVQVVNVDYNTSIPAGTSISIGFNANYSGSNVDPTNLVVVAK